MPGISQESLNAGLARGYLRYLPSIVHDCLQRRCFAQVRPSPAPVPHRLLVPHAPKHLLHPLLTNLGIFEVSDPCNRHSWSQRNHGFRLNLPQATAQHLVTSLALSLKRAHRMIHEDRIYPIRLGIPLSQTKELRLVYSLSFKGRENL